MPDKRIEDKRIALVTGANQGVGRQVAKELVANGLTVLVGSRNFERGGAAAAEIGPGAIALQLDVTDRARSPPRRRVSARSLAASISSFKTRLYPIRVSCPASPSRITQRRPARAT
jgi:NAD(P)-dependent dehydrogenase (short-subunit alcohol dehydrogenase family)